MTHPDIIRMERFGTPYPMELSEKTGECIYCKADVYDDNTEAVRSCDGLFCDEDCCREYYEIRKINEF